jgi:hypothetical protein
VKSVGKLAGAAANGCVAEANRAGAAGFQALRHAVAARLDHFAAGLVSTHAANANAVFRAFTLADATAQIALADRHAVHRAAATAHLVAEHFAKILQRSAGDFIIALAVDLHAIFALLDLERTARGDTPVGHRRRRGRRHAGGVHCAHRPFHHHRTTHKKLLFREQGSMNRRHA